MSQRNSSSVSSTYRLLEGLDLPPALDEMRTPPSQVHLWGKIPPGPYVSIVGTRQATRVGERAAYRLARDLAVRGVTILSGGAKGIDTMAHRGALAGGGQTLVVAPAWWEVASPKSNRELFEQIVSRDGGYLTLAPPGKPLFNPIYFRRNEALMAMSHVCVLGECQFQSGAKNAMLHARRMGRPRYCLPYLFSHATSEGPWEEMIRYGAVPLRRAADLLPVLREAGSFDNPRWWLSEEKLKVEADLAADAKQQANDAWGGTGRRVRVLRRPAARESSGGAESSAAAGRSAVAKLSAVAQAISSGFGSVDAICQETGENPGEVQHEILILTLEGRVFEDDAGVLRYHPPGNARP